MGSTGRPTPFSVPALLADRTTTDPGHVALTVDGVGSLTLRDWTGRSTAMARGLADRGVARGDRIGLIFGGRDWLDFAVAWCAVLTAGAVAVPLSDRLAEPELAYMLADCGATAVITAAPQRTDGPPNGNAPEPRGAPPGALRPCNANPGAPGPHDVEVWTMDDVRDGVAEPAAPGAGDLAQILYTSGTTGRPKGVAASHANLTHGFHPKRRAFAHSRHLLHAFPIGTNAAQVMVLHALTAAPTVVTLPVFTPARFGRAIVTYAPGTVFVVPAMAIELLGAGVRDENVLLLGSAAAALPPTVAAGLAAAFPCATITNYYTSTEAAPAQTIMIYDPDRPAALGRAAAGSELKVADADGTPVPAGETGEVWLRAGAYARRYYGRDDGAVFRDGWVRMGDLGRLDDEGYLYLVDRESDVIKSGAFKVSTVQVEHALFEHDGITDAAVFGIPHPVMGMAVAAAVVSPEPISLTDVRAFLGDRLAGHELPTKLLRLAELPRNQAGKVSKRALRRLTEE